MEEVSTDPGVVVKMGWRPWRGEHQVPVENSVATVITHFEIRGHWMWSDYIRLRSDGPFLVIDILKQAPHDASLERRTELAELLSSFDEGSWIDQDETWITYHVGVLEMHMLEAGKPALTAVP